MRLEFGGGGRDTAKTSLRLHGSLCERGSGPSGGCSRRCKFYKLLNFSLSRVRTGVSRNCGMSSLCVRLAGSAGDYSSGLTLRPFKGS